MELPQDPFMLLSMINMKLRDEYSSLDDLCKSEDLDINILSDKLKNAGFDYMPEINQFR
ncbi:MAG: DUF4250 domain-containing protein [Muribaculaceae bacterium]|nr:DUF4250 domain-containing protein [Muribaculaceae bacterium]